MKNFDVFVIGSGMSGMTIAKKCASKGLSVGITDELPYGGTCALRGCDPKKVLVDVTGTAEQVNSYLNKGINASTSINWQDLISFKEYFVEPVPDKLEKGYHKKGITTFHNPAKFVGENKLQVGNEEVEAKKIVLATGAKPRPLQIQGEELTLTSTDFLNMQQLPASLLFIGGGYIAFEFAHIAARAGAEVTIIHRGKSPLENFEQDIVQHVAEATKGLGIKLVTETEVTKIEKEGSDLLVTGQHQDQVRKFTAEAVFNSSGRVPGISDLDLERGNVKFSKKGVTLNQYLQSISNPNVYAAGDSADTKGLPLTPVAVMEGHIVASNIIKGNIKTPDYLGIPTVVFTIPEMAAVGMTEQQARSKDLKIQVNYNKVSNWFNARRLNTDHYSYKTIIDKETGEILGAHLFGPHAAETINIFSMAIRKKMKAKEIKQMIFSYPSMASDISSMI
ncbi:MAG: dihydrolipoyl dehydrogenase family protein [Candidatus Cyclobacteriaceae bacterium M2_1C_046]